MHAAHSVGKQRACKGCCVADMLSCGMQEMMLQEAMFMVCSRVLREPDRGLVVYLLCVACVVWQAP